MDEQDLSHLQTAELIELRDEILDLKDELRERAAAHGRMAHYVLLLCDMIDSMDLSLLDTEDVALLVQLRAEARMGPEDCVMSDDGEYCHTHLCGATDDVRCMDSSCPHCGGR